jgi:hypothetical protein
MALCRDWIIFNDPKYLILLKALTPFHGFSLFVFPHLQASLHGSKQKAPQLSLKGFVPGTGFEPAHPFECRHLKTVRLPISPPGLFKVYKFTCLRVLSNNDQSTCKLLNFWAAQI